MAQKPRPQQREEDSAARYPWTAAVRSGYSGVGGASAEAAARDGRIYLRSNFCYGQDERCDASSIQSAGISVAHHRLFKSGEGSGDGRDATGHGGIHQTAGRGGGGRGQIQNMTKTYKTTKSLIC